MAGDYALARESYRQVIRIWRDMGYVARLPGGLKLLGVLEVADGNPARGVRLGAAAERFTDEIGVVGPTALLQADDPVETTKAPLGSAEHARGVEEGRAMSLDDAIAFALDERPAADHL